MPPVRRDSSRSHDRVRAPSGVLLLGRILVRQREEGEVRLDLGEQRPSQLSERSACELATRIDGGKVRACEPRPRPSYVALPKQRLELRHAFGVPEEGAAKPCMHRMLTAGRTSRRIRASCFRVPVVCPSATQARRRARSPPARPPTARLPGRVDEGGGLQARRLVSQRDVAAARGFSSGVRTASTCDRRCSNAGGRTNVSPRCSGASSVAKPGPSVAISKRTPLGSRK